MKNNAFFKLIRDTLIEGFREQGYGEIRVMQNFQAKKKTGPVTPTIVVHRIGDRPVHWQSRKSKVVNAFGVLTEEQNWITTFQLNAFVPRLDADNETIDDTSSDDLLRVARMILQGQLMLGSCKKAGLGLLPATVVAPNWVQDEHDNWINEPSFNLDIASKDRLDWKLPFATVRNILIKRV